MGIGKKRGEGESRGRGDGEERERGWGGGQQFKIKLERKINVSQTVNILRCHLNSLECQPKMPTV